jgi:cytochrome c551/c552
MLSKLFNKYTLIFAVALSGILLYYFFQKSPKEEDFFQINKIEAPSGVFLEVGGMCTLKDGSLALTTRRGDVYIVENPSSTKPNFKKFATGLHEPLGIAVKDSSFYVVQRGELTRLKDENKDGKADVYETVYAWPLSGNYHEYSYGPKIAPDGSFFVTLNLGFGDADGDESWTGKSVVPWRGWALHIFEDGTMEPWATGLRSPCGISMIDGELFYTDNQGDWVGSGSLMQLKKGSFTGHPGGLLWTKMPNSPLKLTQEDIYSKVDPRNQLGSDGKEVKPTNIENEPFKTLADMKLDFPSVQLPVVVLPHGILGVSNSETVKIPKGVFGAFEGQLLIGDQGQSKIMRVYMEKVKGELQGCAWDFRSGFQSGIVRLAWGNDGSLFVGETNRGWGSAGDANEGLERLTWNNKLPFEMKTIKAKPDGFEIEFTKPIDLKAAANIASYSIESFTYKYHPVYGSPTVNQEKCPIKGVKVSKDGMSVRIIVSNLRPHYIHKISLDGIKAQEKSHPLLHPTAYYTLNNIPDGASLSMSEVSTKNTVEVVKEEKSNNGAISFAEVEPLLIKNTCIACHNQNKKVVGPPFAEIAKRHYSIEEILQLIKMPQPQNWPDYSTAMAPMPQVTEADARKIAAWINSLDSNK